jgi:Na+/H+ antiporter NhaD/arsenite permease-like protein
MTSWYAVLHIAIAAACIMLLIGKQDPEEIILGVEWPTILFFIGLFIVVGGLKKTGVITILADGLISLTGGKLLLP